MKLFSIDLYTSKLYYFLILLRLDIKLTFAILIFILIPTPPLFKSGFHSFNTYGIRSVIVSLVSLLLPFSSLISVAELKQVSIQTHYSNEPSGLNYPSVVL